MAHPAHPGTTGLPCRQVYPAQGKTRSQIWTNYGALLHSSLSTIFGLQSFFIHISWTLFLRSFPSFLSFQVSLRSLYFQSKGNSFKKSINKKDPDEKISGFYDYHWEKKMENFYVYETQNKFISMLIMNHEISTGCFVWGSLVMHNIDLR